MSRDWVIDKMTVSVANDADLDKAKRVIKDVSKQIMADPELAPNIIEPLKMQGWSSSATSRSSSASR